jgi:hypothetical protein
VVVVEGVGKLSLVVLVAEQLPVLTKEEFWLQVLKEAISFTDFKLN